MPQCPHGGKCVPLQPSGLPYQLIRARSRSGQRSDGARLRLRMAQSACALNHRFRHSPLTSLSRRAWPWKSNCNHILPTGHGRPTADTCEKGGTAVAAPIPSFDSFLRKEIPEYIRACEYLLSSSGTGDHTPLSLMERQVLQYYAEELQKQLLAPEAH